MKNLSIGVRLYILVGFMAFGLLVVGALGIYGAQTAEAELQSIYETRVIPMRELARIRRLMVENGSQVFRALQHNPENSYAQLHDHPVTEHIAVIEKNMKWADDTWRDYSKRLPAGSEEQRLAQEFETMFGQYKNEVLLAELAVLKNGDYSVSSAKTFLSSNRRFEGKLNDALKKLTEVQQESVKAEYEAAVARNQTQRFSAILAMIVSLLLGIGLAIAIIRSIVKPMADMQQVIERASGQHDFTGRVAADGQDEVGKASAAFNRLMGSVSETLGNFRQHIDNIDQQAQQLSSTAGQLAAGAASTSDATSSMAASVEQLASSIAMVTGNAGDALNVSRSSGEKSTQGGRIIQDTSDEMKRMAGSVQAASSSIVELGDQTEKISSIVQVIREVADQTNLLALNAAIEAARAGEQGRGFAVVADEVRKLAERTSTATAEIGSMISAIQASANTAVKTMEATVASVSGGVQLADEAGAAIEGIRQGSDQVADMVQGISLALSEQSAASGSIALQIEQVAQSSEETHAASENAADSARHLRLMAAEMKDQLARYRVR